jgi:phenylacetate-CoA ligase
MLKNIYRQSPCFIQNIILSIGNMLVLYKKYGYIPLIRSMNKIENNIQDNCIINEPLTLIERINDFKALALKTTKYYSDNRVKYPDIISLDDIKSWPILTKAVLKKNTENFYSKEHNNVNGRTLFTSGSTGSPMKVKVGTKDLRNRFHILLKTMLSVGYSTNTCLARVSGNDICDEKKIYRKDFINNEIFLSAFHINSKNIIKYKNAILNNKVTAIEGYPSAIYLLAKILSEKNINITTIKHVFTTAEKLHDYQKTFISSFFGCKIFDYYGSNEQSTFIYTCENGKMHTSDKTGFIEVVDDNYKPVGNGMFGKMLITSLTSSHMPLIRYEIGDTCVLSKDQSCICGEGSPIIDEIIGRDEEVFKTKSGSYITRFSLYLKYLPLNVMESQIILNNNTTKIKLVYSSNLVIPQSDFRTFEELIIEKLGKEYTISFSRVDSIPLTSKGKKKAVIIEN